MTPVFPFSIEHLRQLRQHPLSEYCVRGVRVMRSVTKTFALLGGLALTGLLGSQTVQAADIAPVVEEPAAFGWYVSLFGGPKWGHGDFDVNWERDEYLCERSISVCDVSLIAPVIEHLGHLN